MTTIFNRIVSQPSSPLVSPLPRASHHFEVLDGLRGVAALAVLFGHATAIVNQQSLLDRKGLAVQFFFMLSGFVIAYAYEERLKAGMSLWEFYLRRVIRLYPLIIAGVALATMAFAIGNHLFTAVPSSIASVILAGLALPSPPTEFSFGCFPVNPPEWSLFYELLAYVAFGVLITRANSLHLIAVTGATLGLYVVMLWCGRMDPPFLTRLFGAAAASSIGILLWRYRARGSCSGYRLPFPVLSVLLFAACALPSSWGWGVDAVCVIVLFPILILGGAAHGAGAAGKMERFLGDLSYPLYILHWPIVLTVRHVLLDKIGPAKTIAIACVLAVATAWIAFVYFDRPVRQWLNQRLLFRDNKSSPVLAHAVTKG